MGSSSSKFKKYLHHGDEFAAMQIFQSSPELQKNLNPNLSYGEHYNHDTALHFAAKHGMKHLLRTFLNDLGGNPNKKNGSNETSLHCACQLTHNKTFSAMERRATCVMFIMQWRGASVESGGREKIDLAAQDQNGNTALHVAAASGLEHCVQALITAGSPLYLENNDKMTPCDMAVKNGHYGIAQLLESKMVFDDALDIHNEDELSQSLGEADEVYCGLRTQDLQEAKDQLLVETSDMLQVPLFTAEALLRDNEWSREVLLDKWMKDAVSCCQLAGVEPPQSIFNEQGDVTLDSVPNSPKEEVDIICDICMLTVKAKERPSIKISCNHNFCFQCWETYLSNKILEGMHHDILCPAYQCHILVPIDVIERLVSPDLARRYLHFDIKAFVESNKCIKWCPVAGCGRAVKLPETEQRQTSDELKDFYYGKPIPVTSQAVDCGNGHFFCWECLGEAHAPSGCSQWRQWLEKINQVKPEELSNDMKDLEDASNCLWLVSNSKPCPNCKSPIQKNEGCNHIKCSKCKFDFCWICLEAWKKHSSATGGYFRCNRFLAASKADKKQDILISEAVARSQQIQELNKFLHYYTRYKNHEHSRKLEESLLTTVNHKMEVLASSLVNGKVTSDKEKKCTKFVEDGIRELLKARRVLCGSYVHGFYLEDLGYNKTIFEFMQNELEAVTEKLSEMIARPYLKTPRHTIMQTTSLCRRKRHEFVRAVSKGLIPPETPPTFRKRKRRFPGILVMDPSSEDDMSHLIVASLKSVDVGNSWVKDSQGRHANLTAIYDWPDLDSEEETEVNRALAVSLVGECCREGCTRPKARNPRTQALQDYCSLRCARNGIQLQSFTHDESMDLIIALEMSRLQMIEDTIKRENQLQFKSSINSSVTQTCSDTDLNKAIELSIQQEKTDVAVTTEDITPYEETDVDKSVDYFSSRTNEDLTVDYFLKSLAGKNFQEVSEKSVNIYSPDSEKILREKELVTFRTEDGRFEISDIHETCFHQEESDEQCLRRVRSTGDLTHKDTRKDQYKVDPRYHLDSDHSSQHVERPEEFAKISLTVANNIEKSKRGDHYVLFQQHSGNSVMDEGTCTQSSIDDTMSSDSVIADLEVCNILSSGEISMIRTDEHLTIFEADEKKSNSTVNDTDKFETSKSDDQLNYMKEAESTEINDKNISNSTKLKDENSSKTLDIRPNIIEASLRSESVKNLIEEVKHTLNSIEGDKNLEFLNFHCGGKDFIGQKGSEFLRHCPERASTGKIKSTQMILLENQKSSAKSATALESLEDSDKRLFPMRTIDSNNFLLVGSENSLNEAHKKAFKAAGGKIFKNSNLRIRIANSPVVTDSSNEYETETGIPKSPTLFISGVSISRTPEPCIKDKKSPEHKSRKSTQILKCQSNLKCKNYSSPVLNLIPTSAEKASEAEDGVALPICGKNITNSGRQSRSSSLTNTQSVPEKKQLNVSCGSLAHSEKKGNARKDTAHQGASISPRNSVTFEENYRSIGEAETATKKAEGFFAFGFHNQNGSHDSDGCKKEADGCDGRPIAVKDKLIEEVPKRSGKSKSASEPERDREMFPFPKSSTDGALSSVLHVHENYLSSDDFHEVLFLLERSPKHGSKRKKKSKKERDKMKENSSKEECAEVSSAL